MILLTGASGFIGRHVLSALVAEYGSDHILALTSQEMTGYRCLLHENYTFDREAFVRAGFASIRTIIHLGAFIPKNASQADDWEKSNTNILSTRRLLSSELPELERFIFISTIDVYDNTAIITEESSINPVSLYGHSKLCAERISEASITSRGKLFQSLRLGHVYGPGEEAYRKVIPVAMESLLKDQPLKLVGAGTELRSFIYIKDVVAAVMNCVRLPGALGAINVVGSQKITIRDLLEQLIEISGRHVGIETVPSTTKGRDLVFDNSKMKKFLIHSETPLRQGLEEEWRHMLRLRL